MNPTVKTILMWVLFLVAAVGLWNFLERKDPARTLNFTELVEQVKAGNVSEVRIAGSTLTGTLRGGREAFKSTLPPESDSVYEGLLAAKVRVTIVPTERSIWPKAIVSQLLPMLLAFACGWLCASRWGRLQSPA